MRLTDPARREKRRLAILALFCAGDRVIDIAARHGVTPRYVSYLAKRHNLGRPRGRPRAVACATPAREAEYRKLRRHIGPAAAREAMESAL